MLLDAAEELVDVQLVFTGSGAAQDANMEDDDIAAAGLHAVENVPQVIEIKVVADGDEDIAGAGADGSGSEFALLLEVELVHFDVSAGALAAALGDSENNIEKNGKNAAGHGGDRLGEEVDDGNLDAADMKIERDLEFAGAGFGVAKDENRQAVHRETPDDAECIEVGEESDIAAADDDGDDLEEDDDVDDAVAGAKTGVGLAEPGAEDAIFGNTIENPIGTDDGGIDGAGENQGADDNHEAMKNQTEKERPLEIHGQAADEVFEKTLPNVIGDDHDGKEGDHRGKDQAVNKNYHARFFKIGELGTLDLAIDLGKGLLAAHGQNGMAESDEDGDDAEHLRKIAVPEPAQGAAGEMNIARRGKRGQRGMAVESGVNAPADEDDHHDGDELHDVEGFFAGFRNAFGVFPPEVDGDGNGEAGGDPGDGIFRKRPAGHLEVLG